MAATGPDAWQPRLDLPGARALYLHVPFCARKCRYCDFSSSATAPDDPLTDAYAHALHMQLEEVAGTGLLDGATTAYVGGGTPTLLGTRLAGLVEAIRTVAPVRELSCEANPESLTSDVVRALAEAGTTRLSVGVQSLVDSELAALGRIHDARQAVAALERAVSSGLDVSCDLMCAIPLQTPSSWRSTLEAACDRGVGHVSVYPLMIEDGTPFATLVDEGRMDVPGDDEEAGRMEEAEAFLVGRGFARYEVASYALPGRECTHNEAYWTGIPYLGLGTSAASMLGRGGYARLRQVASQLPELPDDACRARLTVLTPSARVASEPRMSALDLDMELLDARQAAAEDLMLASRMSVGIPVALLDHARRVLGAGRVDGEVSRLVGAGLLADRGVQGLAPTHAGWLLGNALYEGLWGLSQGTIEHQVCRGTTD